MNITFHLRDGRTATMVNAHRHYIRDNVEMVMAGYSGSISLSDADGRDLDFTHADVARIEIEVTP